VTATLAANVSPVSARPGTPLYDSNWLITLTEPVPDDSHVCIGTPDRHEVAYVETCTGTGPYVCRITHRIGRAYMTGTPVAVVSAAEAWQL
jgi:hypothetical protein